MEGEPKTRVICDLSRIKYSRKTTEYCRVRLRFTSHHNDTTAVAVVSEVSIALPELLVKHSKLLYKKLKSHSHEKGTTIRISILVCARPADRLLASFPSPDGGVGCPAEAGRCPPRARSSSDHLPTQLLPPTRPSPRGCQRQSRWRRDLASPCGRQTLARTGQDGLSPCRGRSRPCSASR